METGNVSLDRPEPIHCYIFFVVLEEWGGANGHRHTADATLLVPLAARESTNYVIILHLHEINVRA